MHNIDEEPATTQLVHEEVHAEVLEVPRARKQVLGKGARKVCKGAQKVLPDGAASEEEEGEKKVEEDDDENGKKVEEAGEKVEEAGEKKVEEDDDENGKKVEEAGEKKVEEGEGDNNEDSEDESTNEEQGDVDVEASGEEEMEAAHDAVQPAVEAVVPAADPAPARVAALPPAAPSSLSLDVQALLGAMMLMQQQQTQMQQQQSDAIVALSQTMAASQRAHEEQFRMQQEFNRRMEDSLRDLKQGLHERAVEMDDGVDSMLRSKPMREVFQFIARHGMDTRTGVVVAFPVYYNDVLHVALSLPLLAAALAALFPVYSKSMKEYFTLTKLKSLLLNGPPSQTLIHRMVLSFSTLFAVNPYNGKTTSTQASHDLQAWKLYEAKKFIKLLRASTSTRGTAGTLALRDTEISVDDVDWGAKRGKTLVSFTKTSKTRMTWGRQVQEEVLALPQVRDFFVQVAELGAESTAVVATNAAAASTPTDVPEDPFHFCGLDVILDSPVHTHARLAELEERDRERAAEEAQDDRLHASRRSSRRAVPHRATPPRTRGAVAKRRRQLYTPGAVCGTVAAEAKRRRTAAAAAEEEGQEEEGDGDSETIYPTRAARR